MLGETWGAENPQSHVHLGSKNNEKALINVEGWSVSKGQKLKIKEVLNFGI